MGKVPTCIWPIKIELKWYKPLKQTKIDNEIEVVIASQQIKIQDQMYSLQNSTRSLKKN
jgi:hypothetical protein